MGYARADGICIVMAAKDGKVEYWAAAVRQSQATEAVRRQMAPGWRLILTQHRLRGPLAAELKMNAHSVRQLPPNFTP